MPDRRTILNGHGVGDDVAIGSSFFYTQSLSTPIYKIEENDIEAPMPEREDVSMKNEE